MFTQFRKLVNVVTSLALLLLIAGTNGTASAANVETVATINLKPVSIVTTTGSTTGEVGRLYVKDQSVLADDPLKYVRFETPSVIYQGYRKYMLPPSVSPGAVVNIKVKVNYKGPTKAAQTWSWNLFDWTRNAWVKVGDNSAAAANRWNSMEFNVSVNPSNYVNNLTREIRLSLVSNHPNGDAKLDFESLAIAHHSCEDPLGCVAVRPGAPVHIAYLLNMPVYEAKNGALVARDDFGQVLGHPIRFTGVERENCDPAVATADGMRMRRDASIVAVIGTTCSGEAMAVMPGFSASGFTMVSPTNTNSSLTDPGNPNSHRGYFRTVWKDTDQGKAAAKYAITALGATKAATINNQDGYSAELERIFVAQFTAMGGTITTRETINPGDTDMSVPLGNIAADPPDFIYMPVFLPEAGYIIVQARATAGLETVPLMGSDALFTPDVVAAAGDDVEGFLVTGNDPQQYNPEYNSHFVPAYTARFGVAPSVTGFAPYGYDAFKIIRAAILKVAIRLPDGTLVIGRRALRNALYATRNFPGMTGNLSCSSTGDCADPAIGVYEYHAGNPDPTLIWP